jgi:diguanylate cyclase (GGDEF)-like protein
MRIVIGDIAHNSVTLPPTAKCEAAYSIFNEQSSIEGIVIIKNGGPIGVVMRTHFFQKLSTKYGFDLFMKRSIDLVMKKEFLSVDYLLPITDISALAMKRKQEFVYDFVVVKKQERFFGVVSIRELLMKLSEIQIDIARYSNPLSGLPGNNMIEEMLQEALTYSEFSVIYIDIDFFKAFNDTFGFRQGDEIIQETASIISGAILTKDKRFFVGHIGGDDFIALIPHHDYEPLCRRIMEKFDQFVIQYYTMDEQERGYILAVNRKGIQENVPLVSISLAVVHNRTRTIATAAELSKLAAELKKECKMISKSTFLALA